uniref:Uncharacterized protein n=1 Tax=Arundo donax TaxID=35708 RepID=A0A0A8YJP7_ARUDO
MATRAAGLALVILLLSSSMLFYVVTARENPSSQASDMFPEKAVNKIPSKHTTAHVAGTEEKVLLIGPNILLRPRPMPPCKRSAC